MATGKEIVIDYLKYSLEDFQSFLEDHNVSGAEAEVIIQRMEVGRILTAADITKNRLNYRDSGIGASGRCCQFCDYYNPAVRMGRKARGYNYARRCRLIGHSPGPEFDVLPLFVCDDFADNKIKNRRRNNW